jgi:predicted helicase
MRPTKTYVSLCAATIRNKFNSYRFIDYKESVIDLLQRVCTVSVETMKIVAEMNESQPVSAA